MIRSSIIILLCFVILVLYRKLVPFIYVQVTKKNSTELRLINLMSSPIRSYNPWNQYVIDSLNKQELIDLFMTKLTNDILVSYERSVNYELEYTYQDEPVSTAKMYDQVFSNEYFLKLSKEEQLQVLNTLFYNDQYYWEYQPDKYIFLNSVLNKSIYQIDNQELSHYQLIKRPKFVGEMNAN